MKLSNPSPSQKDIERIQNYDGRNPYNRYEEIQEISRMHERQITSRVSVYACTTYGEKRNCFESKDFGSPIYAKFEGLKVPVPSNYEQILKISYGDWRKMPHPSSRRGWHGNILFEPDIPYNDFIKKYAGVFPDDVLQKEIF